MRSQAWRQSSDSFSWLFSELPLWARATDVEKTFGKLASEGRVGEGGASLSLHVGHETGVVSAAAQGSLRDSGKSLTLHPDSVSLCAH